MPIPFNGNYTNIFLKLCSEYTFFFLILKHYLLKKTKDAHCTIRTAQLLSNIILYRVKQNY